MLNTTTSRPNPRHQLTRPDRDIQNVSQDTVSRLNITDCNWTESRKQQQQVKTAVWYPLPTISYNTRVGLLKWFWRDFFLNYFVMYLSVVDDGITIDEIELQDSGTIFTARRSYASVVLVTVILSVRPSVCLSYPCLNFQRQLYSRTISSSIGV